MPCSIFSKVRWWGAGRRALVVLLASIALLPNLSAAAAPAQPAAGDDLRAAFATPQDIAEGKRVALASCASCHSITGIALAKGTPHIAGQRPAYLYAELRVYQAGRRGDNPMNNVVKFLSDDALVKVSAYYASLDPAPPAPASAKKASKADPAAAGKDAAAGCSGCHGDIGISDTPGMPNLVGLDAKYLVAAIGAYKTGQRKHGMMKTLVSALSDAEINSISVFYALQKPGKAKTPATGNKAAGKTAATACAGCHGEGGVSTGTAPSLAGQDAQYFAGAMQAYKTGARTEASMKAPAASLDDTAMKDLAAYYADQTPQPPRVKKPMTTEEVADRCNRCHGVDGNSTDPRTPAIAAQRADYLDPVMRAYRKGDRKSTAMSAMLDGMSDDEIAELAGHYSRQKSRSVVYVPVPTKP
ncbi:MAG TPA: c-type cytochrome [Ramlibacter sp.]|nr:c-type cytochrome [Ramlibacter sp.]